MFEFDDLGVVVDILLFPRPMQNSNCGGFLAAYRCEISHSCKRPCGLEIDGSEVWKTAKVVKG